MTGKDCTFRKEHAVLYYRRGLLSLISLLALVLAVALPAQAENTQINATDLLAEGQQQFQNQDYVTSRTSLWKAYGKKAELSDTQRQVLAGLLGEVDQAIQAQVVDKAQYAVAEESLKAQNWKQAREGFAKTADSPYVSPTLRAKARDQLAMVEMKLAASMATDAEESDKGLAKAEAVLAASEQTDDLKFVDETGEEAAPEEEVADVAPAAQTKTIAQAPAQEAGPSDEQAKKIKVEMLITQGKDALNKDQAAKAVDLYSRALELDPNNEVACTELNKAKLLTARPTGSTFLAKYEKELRIEKQIAEQEIQQNMKRSMELMAKPVSIDTFDAAEQAAKVAKNILQNNKRLFSTSEYRTGLAKSEDQLRWIRGKRDEFTKKSLREQVEQIEAQNRDRSAKVRVMRDQRIADLTTRAQSLLNEDSYQQALSVMEEILELDSKNTWAIYNSSALKRIIIIQQQKKADVAADMETSKLSADIRNTEIPWYELIRYPKDWKALTARRERYGAGQINESEEDRKANQKLEMKMPKFDFPDLPFSEVVDYIRENSGANIFVNWKALEAAGIDNTQTVSIKLTNVSFRKALELALNDVGGGATELAYAVNDGVVSISTRENLNRETETRVYDIRDLLIRIPNFPGTRVSLDAIGSSMGSSGDSGGSSSSESLFDDEDSEDNEDEDVAQTRSELIASVRNMITETIAPDSWRPEGEIGAINELHGNLVITQTSENHRKVHKLISSLRESRTIQVAIEARFITVNTGFLSQIGVDLDFYFNLGSTIDGATATDPITGAQVPAAGSSTWQNQGYSRSRQLRNFSPIGVSQSSMNFADVMTQTTNVAAGIGKTMGLVGGAPAMSIVGTFLDDVQVDFLIEATQAHQSTRTLTAPRLTLFNGQRANVSIQTSQAYISGIEQVVSENATAPQPEISYAPTGTMLDVDAIVSHDRRYVTMTLRPQVVTLNLNDNGQISGTNVSGVFIGLPVVTLQNIETTVSVPDGGTLLIGGQKLTGEVEREMGVPVLSKLPIINRAFTNKGKLRDEETLLILIKPTIIISDEAERDPAKRLEEPTFDSGLGME